LSQSINAYSDKSVILPDLIDFKLSKAATVANAQSAPHAP
jgi:hypothetical protein